MRTLVSTFGPGDSERVLDAMRALPYDRLVILGERGADSGTDFERLSRLEAASGQAVEFVETGASGFLDLVEEVTEALVRLSKDGGGRRTDLCLNISGGPKLLGNAALLAAFRLGIRTYHCDGKAVKLPVVTGATSKDRFTPGQLRMIEVLADRKTIAEAADAMMPMARQGTERVIRELRKAGLLESSVVDGRVTVDLTPSGREVLRAVQLDRRDPR
ncbi:MAG: hypothetical protein MUE55_00315 [Thermoplasmata archaeon]|nr:hypothetical protein [Thermoplasmata archaeon]